MPVRVAAADAVARRSLPLGLRFNERMRGGFAPGATDPATGAKAGAKTPLTLQLNIDAPNLKRFLSDPDHAARITGTVTWAELGKTSLPLTGTLRLLPNKGGKTLMQYALDFQKDGKPYSLVGTKYERPGVLHVWKDTTTLYTELHEGKGGKGPITGAGVVGLKLPDVVRLATSMRAEHARGIGDELTALEKFGRFFIGGLWDKYIG
jgi:hypothetical protein